ncbi:hypothetical protein Tco_0087847 [Tanacetum coccineum]
MIRMISQVLKASRGYGMIHNDGDRDNDAYDDDMDDDERDIMKEENEGFLGGNSSSGTKKYRGSNSSDGGNTGDGVKIVGGVIGPGGKIGEEVEHPEPGFELQGAKMVEMGRFGTRQHNRRKLSLTFETMGQRTSIFLAEETLEEPIVLVEEESCLVYYTDNEKEESMLVYDIDIEDVIEEEERFVGKGGLGREEDNIEDVVLVANDLCSLVIQTILSLDFEEDINTKSHELMSFEKIIIIKGHWIAISTELAAKPEELELEHALHHSLPLRKDSSSSLVFPSLKL